MATKVIGRANNLYFTDLLLFDNNNITLKFSKLLKIIIGSSWSRVNNPKQNFLEIFKKKFQKEN